MKYLITDLNIKMDGHRFGFVNNLLHYAGKEKKDDHFVFLVNRSEEFNLVSVYPNIEVLKLNQEEQQAIDSTDVLMKKARIEWSFICKYALVTHAERVILMFLDSYQMEIGKTKTPFKISGIWFAPYARMEAEDSSFKSKLKLALNKMRKKSTMKWALRNNQMDKVFILNDEQMPAWLNQNETRFYMLPDPYFNYAVTENFDLKEQYNIPKSNLVFLQFGYIDERKNLENIVRSFNLLPHGIAQKTTLLVVGKFKPGFKEHLVNLKSQEADFQMIFRDEFVSDEEMESTFSQADVILRMNINFFGSSGIIGVAAQHDKPVIASNTGVMAEIVEKYKLGAIVNPYDTKEIAQAVKDFHSNPSSLKIDGSKYRNSHDLKSFAETILSQ